MEFTQEAIDALNVNEVEIINEVTELPDGFETEENIVLK